MNLSNNTLEEILELDFNSLTEKERESISSDVWKKIPDHIKRSCDSCHYLIAKVNFWCSNEDAKEYRGTSIPGVCKCKFWKKSEKLVKPENEPLFLIFMLISPIILLVLFGILCVILDYFN